MYTAHKIENDYFPIDELFESFPNISIFGNKDYHEYTTRFCDFVMVNMDDAACAVYDLDHDGPGWPWEDIPEAVNNYLGDWDGPLTDKQIEDIANILREYDKAGYKDEESFIARIMSVIDGQKYVCRMIRGCCQSEWNYLVMPENELENLDYISRTYWGLYDAWEIDDAIVYTYGYTETGVRNELATAIGCTPEEIELEGWSR